MMKQTEARIIVFLKNVSTELRYARYIAAKLGISYNYIIGTLKEMEIKGWIKSNTHNRTNFYTLKDETVYVEAFLLTQKEAVPYDKNSEELSPVPQHTDTNESPK